MVAASEGINPDLGRRPNLPDEIKTAYFPLAKGLSVDIRVIHIAELAARTIELRFENLFALIDQAVYLTRKMLLRWSSHLIPRSWFVGTWFTTPILLVICPVIPNAILNRM
jgi:hypothetical protein